MPFISRASVVQYLELRYSGGCAGKHADSWKLVYSYVYLLFSSTEVYLSVSLYIPVINPRQACAAWVTVLGLSVLSVCLSVCLSVTH